jgi:hypothetical protein
VSETAAPADDLPETVTLTIDPAIEWNGKTFDSLTLRRPTFGEMMEHDKRGGGSTGALYLVGQMSGVPAQALVKADAALVQEASEVIQDFLAIRQRRKAGAT